MLPGDAIDLVNHPAIHNDIQQWADLGAGTGTFTDALVAILHAGSSIYAIDNDAKALQAIKETRRHITVRKIKQDFTQFPLPFEQLNGMVMANSLHYVNDQSSFLLKLKNYLKPGGSLLLVEYDTEQSNQWVPFPISRNRIELLAVEVGFSSVQFLARKPSVYQEAIYSVLLR